MNNYKIKHENGSVKFVGEDVIITFNPENIYTQKIQDICYGVEEFDFEDLPHDIQNELIQYVDFCDEVKPLKLN